MLGRDKVDKLVEGAFKTMEEENADEAIAGCCLLLIEVRTADDETAFYTFSNDRRQWIQRALINEAREAIEFGAVEETD